MYCETNILQFQTKAKTDSKKQLYQSGNPKTITIGQKSSSRKRIDIQESWVFAEWTMSKT